MKNFFASILLFVAACLPVFGQSQPQPQPAQAGDIYVASIYGSYTSQVSTGNTSTGSASIKAAPVAVTLANGTVINPFVANTSKTINRGGTYAETVTPTVANCYAGSITCTLSATFSNKHASGEAIQSGTFGLQEAINAAQTAGSGTVLVDATFQGPSGSALIAASTGSTAVVIQDNRSGTPQFYKWNGSAYQLQASGGSSLNLPVSALGAPNVVYTLNQTTDQGTSTQFTDISGNGNNAIFGATGCSWTGTGCDFTTSNQSVVNLPASINGDESYCADVSFPLYFQAGAGGNGSPTFNFFLSSATINTTGISWLVAGSDQIYKQFSFNGGIQTQATNAEAGNHVICWVQGLSNNSTNDRFFTDGVENTYSGSGRTGGGQTSGHLVFGRNNFSQPGYFFGTLYNFVGWPGQITAAQATAASNVLKNAALSNGVQVTPPAVLTSAITFTGVGDSITDGFGATTPWTGEMTLNAGYAIINEGYYGITAQSINGQARWRDAPRCSSGYYKNMVILFAGTNDVSNGVSAGVTFGYLQSYASLLTQAGCQVGVVTMLSRTGEDTAKNALNPLIRAGASVGGYFVVDAASVVLLGADGAYAGGDFNLDGVHPNQTGQNALGSVISNAVNAYGIGSATSAAPTIYASNTVTMVSADRFTQIIPTGAATATLPDCLGVTGTTYVITNLSAGANTITVSGKAGEDTGLPQSVAQGATAKFLSQLTSQATGGCFWIRTE